MGRAIMNFLALVFLGGLIARGGAALDLWELPDFGGAKMSMDECLADGRSGFDAAMQQLPPDQVVFLRGRFEELLPPVCREWLEHPETRSLTQESGPRFMSKLIRENPSIWEPFCFAVIDSEFERSEVLRHYVTGREKERFRRDACRLQIAYMREDVPMPDYGALVVEHPRVYVPFCAPFLQARFDRSGPVRKRFTRAERRTIARRSCMLAMRGRVIDAGGPGGLRNPIVDEGAFKAIVARVARDVAA